MLARPPEPRWFAVGMTDVPADDHWLHDDEAARLRNFAYTKRRAESRLGRWTAKRTLALALDQPDDTTTLRALGVRNAADGAPEVFVDGQPAPLCISMTDRADWAVCTVLAGATAIGCDLELVEPRSDAFVRDWFTESEQALVASRPVEHDLLANLIWSAKESALKVLRTGLRRDTRSVEVTLHDGADAVGGWTPLTVSAVEGADFAGWWRRFGDFVLTYASAAPTGPPVSLHEPSPLSTARPGHSWMLDPHPERRAATSHPHRTSPQHE